ncbi:unnamed protein product [Cuscuta epithymum]|uniref:Glycosyltransferase n=1 Tax=Cuscuta epithymum TaxID=186058 RepID=A0AAV0CLT3_9ASTE|nr:unnamed protein product [Cuscuta epithymum]
MAAENVGNGIRVLMFPWLAVGHITPFLELAKKLSQRGFCIHLCSTPINLSFIKNKIPQKYSSSIQLLELHLPESPELPPHYHTTNGLPPHLNSTLHKALKMAEPTFSDIMGTMKPGLLIYDVLQPWVATVAKSHNVPAVQFMTSCAVMTSYAFHAFYRPNEEYPFPDISLSIYDQERFQKIMADIRSKNSGNSKEKNMILLSSSRAIEGNKYVDYISELAGSKVLTVGSLVQEYDHDEGRFRPLMEWLGTKEERSTVFVSFGSEYFLSDHDMHQVAIGLEKSKVNFIWVVRFPKSESTEDTSHQNLLETSLPKGFVERIGDRGRVVEGWAPQVRILSHPSIGGFVSHCGWNSTIESIQCSVPIIAMPMHLDQPLIAKLIVSIGVGIEVERDESGMYHGEDIARGCDEIVLGRNAEKIRRNVKVMSENVRVKSSKEMDEVSTVLAQLCSPH